jgi:carbonic anhydrase
MMEKLREGYRRYRAEVFPRLRPELERLMREGQRPETLVIACSDSRIKLNEFTQTGPGELFVVRNAGNIVPPWSSTPSGVAASIEFAVVTLPVRDIIVAGHTGCGAMQALIHPAMVEKLPAVKGWLEYARKARRGERKDALAETTKANVLLQLEHLRTYPCVRDGLEAARLALHGWVYVIETGEVWEHTGGAWKVMG